MNRAERRRQQKQGRPTEPALPAGDAATDHAFARHQAGRLDEAETLYRRRVREAPLDARAHHGLALVLRDRGDLPGAGTAFETALGIDPGYVEARYNYGVTLIQVGAPMMATQHLALAIDGRPDWALAHRTLGEAMLSLHAGSAAAALRDALALDPADGRTWASLATALLTDGAGEAADDALGRAVSLAPDLPETRFAQLTASRQRGRLTEAMRIARHLTADDVPMPAAWQARASLEAELGDYATARATIGEAVRRFPDRAELAQHQAEAILQTGDLKGGYAQYEDWLDLEAMRRGRSRRPLWDGKALPGGTVLVEADLGFGDAVQYARFLPGVAALAGRVILRASTPMRCLPSLLGARISFTSREDAAPRYDRFTELSRLPYLFGADDATLPGAMPYLVPDPGAVERWRAQLAAHPGRKIGIVWAGNPRHYSDCNRSMPIEALAPLTRIPGLSLFSLQVGARTADLARLPPGSVIDIAPHLTDYAETAAALAVLDGVASVDTAVAHLAGALGRPVSLMLSTQPDGRWQLGRTDTPWYSSVTLYRQRRPRDWAEPVADLAARLSAG